MRNRHVRITIAIILAAMLAIGFVAPFALATTDDANLGEIPPAVTAAVEPDGEVARHVAGLATQTSSPAPARGKLAGAQLTFGPLARFILLAEDPAGSGLRLTREDLADSAPQFVAVVSADGEPADLVEIAADGSFIALGGQSEQIVRAVAGAEAGSLLLRDPANSATYLVDPQLEELQPLDAAAKAAVGGAITAVDFRQRVLLRATEQVPDFVPASASPTPDAASPIGSPWLPTIVVSVAVIIVIALAWALARSNRHLDL